MSAQMSWLLLDYRDDLLKELYEHGEEPDPYRLFDTTELAAYSAQSPLLVSAERNPGVLKSFHDDPERWPGLLLQTSRSFTALLQHLRHILIVRFERQHKGVLLYFSPRTASYFFSGKPAELAAWLGPIAKLSWHGGTWQDQAQQAIGLRTVINPLADSWEPPAVLSPLHLTLEQEQALQDQQAGKFLYQWWKRQSLISFSQARVWLKEGLQLNLRSTQALTHYLDLRRWHPHQSLPVPQPATGDNEMIEYLRVHFQRHMNDKERYS